MKQTSTLLVEQYEKNAQNATPGTVFADGSTDPAIRFWL
jgi:hypothetical protein